MLILPELETFVKAAETCNFSEAARRLRLTQPAVSLQVRSLEQRLQTPLFRRNGRSVRLSEAGEILLPMARELLLQSRRVEDAIEALRGEVAGELSLACTTASGKYLLPRLISAFRGDCPRVRATIEVTSQDAAISAVLRGTSDLGVTSSLMEHRGLEYRPFFTDRIVLIVARGHRWVGRPCVGARDLLEEPILVREPSSGTRKVLLAALAAHGILLEDLNLAMELGNAEAIAAAVEAGIGVAFISTLAAAKSLELGYVHALPVEGLDLSRPIFLVRNRAHAASRAQAAFWEFVRSPRGEDVLGFAQPAVRGVQ